MSYIPSSPSVQLGLVDVKLPNGQIIRVPRAFLDRIRYDLSVSGQLGRFTPEEMLMQYYLGGTPNRNQYIAYGGFTPSYLQQLQQLYGGQGRMIQNTQPYQQMQNLVSQRQAQRQALQKTGANRIIRQTANGQVLSDTGRPTTTRDIQKLQPAIRKQEHQAQSTMMKDLFNFRQLAKNRTVSNVPIKVTSNSPLQNSIERDLSRRIARQNAIKRQAIPRQVDNAINRVI